MLNPGKNLLPTKKSSIWKIILVVAVATLAIVYASPSIFGEMPAIQVSPKAGYITQKLVSELKDTLAINRIEYSSLDPISKETIQIKLLDKLQQEKVRGSLQQLIGKNYTVASNVIPNTPKWLSFIGARPINLGLDLRGGMYLVLESDTQMAINSQLDNVLESITSMLEKQGFRFLFRRKANQDQMIMTDLAAPDSYISSGYISLGFSSKDKLEKALDYIANTYIQKKENHLTYTTIHNSLIVKLSSNEITEIKKQAIQQVIMVMRNRVNALGVAEASVVQSGSSHVIVQLPGLQDATRAKQILGGTSTANFYILKHVSDPLQSAEDGSQVYPLDYGQRVVYYQLDGGIVAGGSQIIKAFPGVDPQTGSVIVGVELSSDAAEHFREVTSKNINNLMGVMLTETSYQNSINDKGRKFSKICTREKLINVARIQSPLGARFQITGLDQREANDLALMIRSGALQVPVHIIQEQQIGPTLGKININLGVTSIVFALAIIALFMVAYYHVFGIIANISLVLNLILIIAVMSMIPGATLTLPGIAGIILNLGIAIDSNVLIFERVREEIRNNTPAHIAIDKGYGTAFRTILDSNITTFIVAVILFSIGTGTVKGFAVTLVVGIITSMFTSLVVSRVIVDWIYKPCRDYRKLSIGI